MAQGLTLLHSDHVQASRDFIPLWGNAGPVVEDHAACVANAPSFQGYPSVVYEDATGQRHVIFNPDNMATVEAWKASIDNPPKPSVMSKYQFATRMLTPQEGMAIKALAKTDPQMEYAQDIYALAQEVDLRDPNVAMYLGAAEQAKILSADRVAQILAGIPVN